MLNVQYNQVGTQKVVLSGVGADGIGYCNGLHQVRPIKSATIAGGPARINSIGSGKQKSTTIMTDKR